MITQHQPAQEFRELALAYDALEQWVVRLAELVRHLTALADRYEQGMVQAGSPATVARVARIRRAAAAGRDGLVALALVDPTAMTPTPGEDAAGRLGPALTARTVIGQAQGVLMHRYRVSANAARAILQLVATDRDVTCGQAARDVIGAGDHDFV